MVECELCGTWHHISCLVDQNVDDYVCISCVADTWRKCASSWRAQDLRVVRVYPRAESSEFKFFGFNFASLPALTNSSEEFLRADLDSCFSFTSPEFCQRASMALVQFIHKEHTNEALVFEFLTAVLALAMLGQSQYRWIPEHRTMLRVGRESYFARSDRMFMRRNNVIALVAETKNVAVSLASGGPASEPQNAVESSAAAQHNREVLDAQGLVLECYKIVGVLCRGSCPTVYNYSFPRAFLDRISKGKRPAEELEVAKYTAYEEPYLVTHAMVHPQHKVEAFNSLRAAIILMQANMDEIDAAMRNKQGSRRDLDCLTAFHFSISPE